jgi:hypothetical protein
VGVRAWERGRGSGRVKVREWNGETGDGKSGRGRWRRREVRGKGIG